MEEQVNRSKGVIIIVTVEYNLQGLARMYSGGNWAGPPVCEYQITKFMTKNNFPGRRNLKKIGSM
jgi:hypothetical protein